jgi:hypothetical protein
MTTILPSRTDKNWLSVVLRSVGAMSNSDDLYIVGIEEDLKAWCPSTGENVGRMIEIQGSDEWYITCPTCGTRWAGGSTVLSEHKWPGSHANHPSRR